MFWFAPPGAMGVVSAKAVGIGHVLAAERGRAGERYILNGENISHRALMADVANVAGVRPPRLVLPRIVMRPAALLLNAWNAMRSGPPLLDGSQVDLSARAMCFDGDKATRELGFPLVSARSAVEEAWMWYCEFGLLSPE